MPIHLRSFHVAMAIALVSFLTPDASLAETIADSIADWSATGTQGENNWSTGYRNFTADGGGDYAIGQFIPFDNGMHWNGTSWALTTTPGDTGGPWTSAADESAHPNGTNSAPNEEHWVIRRWEASVTMPQDLELRTTMRATNTGCGSGTTVNLYQNGSLLDSLVTNAGANLVSSVYSTVSPGDILDLALTPVGTDGDAGDGCDGTAFSLAITNDPPPVGPLADSFDDWSTTGTQGERNWFNGYYDRTNDADGTYQTADFMAFTNSAGPGGGPVATDGNHWDGTKWDLDSQGSPGPWTEIQQLGTHPNGTNSAPNAEHWTIRRWVADVAGPQAVALNWSVAKANTSGDGVSGHLYVNGVRVDTATIAGSDGVGRQGTIYANVQAGDIVDLALSPQGLTNDSDGSDGSNTRLTINGELPDGPLFNPKSPPNVLADSVAEFSDTQGQDNWLFGYYDQRADVEAGNGAYDAEDFIPFLNDGSGVVSADPAIGGWKTSSNHWDGSKWDLLANAAPVSHGPWTELSGTGGHPAANAQGDPEVQWAMRRWVSELDGFVRVEGLLNNTSASGDGTVGRIFVDGEEVWSELTNGTAVSFSVDLEVDAGSLIDFAIDPDGLGVFDPANPDSLNSIGDGSDGTAFSFTIQEVMPFEPVPEPSGVTLLVVGLLGWLARRRRR